MTTLTKSAKTAALAFTAVIAAASMTTATSSTAYAGDRAVAAGVIGLAAGTVLGAAISQPRHRGHVVVYEEPRVVHRRGAVTPAGVSVRHANWCASKYRSYDWNTNTFVTYSGRVRQCR